MLCRIFFQLYIKNKTEITEIDIAESKIQLKRISLQLNPRERRNLLNSREGNPSEALPQAMYYSR